MDDVTITRRWGSRRECARRRSENRPTPGSLRAWLARGRRNEGKHTHNTCHRTPVDTFDNKENDMTTETPVAATRTVDGREVPTVGTWSLDPTHTTITFEVRHMMISKVRGSFGSESGMITVADDPLDSEVEIAIDIASVESGTEDRDNHLRSPDFFDAETYPQMTFHSTNLETAGDGYRMTGDLTIKDMTRPVVLDFEFTGGLIDPYGNPRVAFSASFEANREDWDLTWNMALETGGLLVGKHIKVSVDTEAVKAS
jgi:polyisoprenoid-binding protein YceI